MRKPSPVDVVGATLLAALGLGGCVSPDVSVGQGGDGSTSGSEAGGSEAGPGETGTNETGLSETGAAEGGSGDVEDGGVHACSTRGCLNPTPLLVGDADTGYDICEGADFYVSRPANSGILRRRAVMACPSLLPRPTGGACAPSIPAPDGGQLGACESDSDCQGYPNGHCELWSEDGGTPVSCQCLPGCTQDSDCQDSEICLCASPVGTCVAASCLSGDSCASGCECITSSPGGNCASQFDCQTPSDECSRSEDCDAGQICSEAHGEHTCQPGSYCGVGRPFLVHGTARLAWSVERSDWSETSVAPDLRQLPGHVREHLAAYWTRVGLMEHASIAAFARFALQLLALGAPSELVRSTHEAIGDETEHARLAFALATAYGGKSIGPGELAIDGSLDGLRVDAVLATLLREGCIGETLAAIEANEALGDARDPAVRAVLATIARDETRHATLAWQTLAWLLESGRIDRARAQDEVVRALAEAAGPSQRDEAEMRGFGILTDERRSKLRKTALASVIAPCARAVLGTKRTGSNVGAPARSYGA